MQIDIDSKGNAYRFVSEGARGIRQHTILTLGNGWVLHQLPGEEPRRYLFDGEGPITLKRGPLVFLLDGNENMFMFLDRIKSIEEITEDKEMPSDTFRQRDPDHWEVAMTLHSLAMKVYYILETLLNPMFNHDYMLTDDREKIRALAQLLRQHFAEEKATAPLDYIIKLAFVELGFLKPEHFSKVSYPKLRTAILKKADQLEEVLKAALEHNRTQPKLDRAVKAARFCEQLRKAVHKWGMTKPNPSCSESEQPTQ